MSVDKFEGPRPHQKRIISELHTIYDKFPEDPRAFLEACTGSGKTIASICFLLERFKGKKAHIVWTAHQNQLINQGHEALFKVLNKKYDPSTKVVKHNKITFEFITWQSLVKRSSSFDFLVIDEAHCGSANAMTKPSAKDKKEAKREHSSFKAIMKLAKSHLYVSATPQNLDASLYPKLLGTRLDREGNKVQCIVPGRKVSYDMFKAHSDGVITNAQFLCVNTVDTIKLRDLESGVDIGEETFDTVKEGAEVVLEKKVNYKHQDSKRHLERSLLESMLDVFFKKEVKGTYIPQTIIFCSTSISDSLNITSVREAVIKKLQVHKKENMLKLPTLRSLVRAVTAGDANKDMEAFQRNDFPILLVVGMGKEGFDAPSTSVLIDLAHNLNNARNLIQKIGRAVRLSPGKQFGRYYYPATFDTYLKMNGTKTSVNAETREKIEALVYASSSEVSEQAIDAAENALHFTAIANDTIQEGNGTDSGFGGVELIKTFNKGIEKETYVASTFIVSDAVNNENAIVFEVDMMLDGKNRDVVSGDQTNWEFYEALPYWEELVRMCIAEDNGIRTIEEAYNALQK